MSCTTTYMCFRTRTPPAKRKVSRHSRCEGVRVLTFIVQFQGGLITELISFNQRIHASVEDLHTRLKNLEALNIPALHKHHSAPAGTFPLQTAFDYRPRGDARSRSPSPGRADYRVRDAASRSKKVRKDLEIKIPDKKHASPAVGLPTPMTFSQVGNVSALTIATRGRLQSCSDFPKNKRLTKS
jgi:hypothetical protein